MSFQQVPTGCTALLLFPILAIGRMWAALFQRPTHGGYLCARCGRLDGFDWTQPQPPAPRHCGRPMQLLLLDSVQWLEKQPPDVRILWLAERKKERRRGRG